MKLEEVRAEIDAIDDQLISLLTRRMDCSLKVAEIKAAEGLEVYHPKREELTANILWNFIACLWSAVGHFNIRPRPTPTHW